MNRQILTHKLHTILKTHADSIKTLILALCIGAIAGTLGTFLSLGFTFVTILNQQNPWLLALLPFGGLATVALYHVFKDPDDVETNLTIDSIRSNDSMIFRVAPLMFTSTLITHLLGGSAGGEGPALRLGGSVGKELGRLFRVKEGNAYTLVLCGMSAGLTPLIGAPMASAMFAVEIVSVGVFEYSSLLPCVVSAMTASGIAHLFGVYGEHFHLASIPLFRLKTAAAVCILAVACSLMGVICTYTFHYTERLYKRYLKNHYVRAAIGGILAAVCIFLLGQETYGGSGFAIVQSSIRGEAASISFFLKMIVTALTLGAGFKGGELLPSMSVGASLGCLLGTLVGFNPGFCAAIGLIALFCGITSSPIAALFLGCELFGYDAVPYYFLAVAFSYGISEYINKHQSSRNLYKKYRSNYLASLPGSERKETEGEKDKE